MRPVGAGGMSPGFGTGGVTLVSLAGAETLLPGRCASVTMMPSLMEGCEERTVHVPSGTANTPLVATTSPCSRASALLLQRIWTR